MERCRQRDPWIRHETAESPCGTRPTAASPALAAAFADGDGRPFETTRLRPGVQPEAFGLRPADGRAFRTLDALAHAWRFPAPFLVEPPALVLPSAEPLPAARHCA
jgi:hypothetical protein